MTGSLLIGDYDVLAEDSPVWLVVEDLDMGAPAPDTQTVSRVLLDGDVVSGVRSGNREVTLKLAIGGRAVPVSAQQAAVIRTALFRTVDQQQWTMQWTPGPGMSAVLFDCYRGTMSRAWQYLDDADVVDFVTLSIPALPFTRDATATMLTPPAVATTPTVIDSMEPGGPTAPAYMAEVASLTDPQYELRYTEANPVAALATDFPQSTASADTAQFAVGTQSRKITQQVITVGQFRDGAWQETTYAPLTTAGVLAGPVDLSGAGSVSWQARADSGSSGSGSGVVVVDPTTVGVAVDARDDSSLSASIGNGTWALTLIDSSGRSATWLTQGRPSASWGSVSVDLTLPPGWTQDGFDITTVSEYRLRLYRINATLALIEGDTDELYPSDQGGAPANLTGCAAIVGGTPSPELSYFANAYVPVQSNTGATLAKWSHPVTVPVTAGQTYSASAGIYASANNVAVALVAAYSCGIEWLDAGGAVLSDSMGATVAAAAYQTSNATTGGAGNPMYLALPAVQGVTAPASAVKARLRFTVDAGATALNDQFFGAAPRIVPGATSRRYRYGSGIIEKGYSGNGSLPAPPGNVATALWVDQMVANPATTGITLTKSYGHTQLPAVGGVARCPVSLAVAAQAQVNWLLLARTPNPPARFMPVLDAPSSAGDTADATALRGAYQRNNATFTLPTVAYNSTYAILARIRPLAASGATAKLTIADSNLSTVLSLPVAGTVNVWQWAVFGAITLPLTATAPQNSSDTFTITYAATGYTVDLDILVLVDISGEMLVIDSAKLSDGAAPTEFWLDSPDSDEFTGTAWVGSNADRSDAVSAGKWQSGQAVFNFEPVHPNMITIVADGGTTNTLPQVALTYARRWAGEAVPDGAV